MSLKRWKITVEYDGTGYSGWQTQDNVPTIQGELEKALKAFCQQNIRIHGAGRTDAGVHAWGQVAHFDLDHKLEDLTGFELAKAMNAHLRPQPITVIDARIVDEEFHARFGAKHKTYHYHILSRPHPPTLDALRLWYVKKKLDLNSIQDAAQALTGHHDFTSFRDSACQAKSPIRTLDHIEITKDPYDDFGGELFTFSFEAQSFLHHQVRNIVGTLKLVGEGKWEVCEVEKALLAKDRSAAGPTAPAHGLFLKHIDYSIE